MVKVPTDFKRLYLRSVYWEAQRLGISLLESLQIAAQARYTETASGKFLTGTSANGKSASFSLGSGSASPDQIAGLSSEMLDRYDEAVRFVTERGQDASDPIPGVPPAPAEQPSVNLFNEMMALLQPHSTAQSSFVAINQ